MHCCHFDVCGGCSYRFDEYEKELRQKEENIRDIFSCLEIRLDDAFHVKKSKTIDFYRHKMEFSFGVWDEQLKLGLHQKGLFYKVIDIEDCRLQGKYTVKILDIVRNWAHKFNILAYHKKRRTGILRHLIIRETKNIPQIMINLIAKEKIDVKDLIDELKTNIPILSSVYLGVNPGISDVAYAEDSSLVYGNECLEEKIGDYKYKIGPYTFFQNNIFGIELLYDKALEYLGKGKILLDLYSGVGTISIHMSQNYEEVLGVELIEDSVRLANLNASINNINNVEFIKEDTETYLHSFKNDGGLLDIIVDPPRKGLEKRVVKNILKVAPKKIVYVSCNPKTMARDIADLTDYKISKIEAIDMFPHTLHVEMIALLERID